MRNVRQNQLPESDIEELNLLENLEMRTSNLCNELKLKEDIHLSWADLCGVLYPSNPSKLADKIFDYYNKSEINDEVYYKIIEALENIGEDDKEFYNCDVLWFQSIATIIYRYFKGIWWLVTDTMDEIHRQFLNFDMDVLLIEAIPLMRERRLIRDDLFSNNPLVTNFHWYDIIDDYKF